MTWGWRSMYWLASGLMVALAIVMANVLPHSQPSLKISYWHLMRSLTQLVQEQPRLQQASLIGAMSFGAFSAFWSTLAFLLEQPPYHYGSDVKLETPVFQLSFRLVKLGCDRTILE